MKKYFKIIAVVALLAVAYLYLAHTYIYRYIGRAHLPATDQQHSYVLNGNMATGSKKIVYAALGDSLTAGVGTGCYEESYPYLISQYLAGNSQELVHLNFSYPGARSADARRDLLASVVAAQPDIITVLLGTNDVHGFVGTTEFRDNYRYILSELIGKTQAEIYVVSIPDIGSHSLVLPPYSNYFASKIVEFNGIIKSLAVDFDLKYIDLATPTADLLQKDGTHYAADLFHPSATGYAAWAKIIYDNFNK